jgi:hypothetical protein
LTGSRCTPMEPATTTTCGFRPELCFATNTSEFATLRVTEKVALIFSLDSPTGIQDNRAIEVSLAQHKSKNVVFSPYGIAQLYADLGEKDHTFEWLNTAYQEHDTELIRLRTDFRFDSLRSDPRYVELVRKVGLPQS